MEMSMADSTEVIPPKSLSLADLATQLNSEHQQVKSCVMKGATHAVKAGQLLWIARRTCPRGQWLQWLAENCEFSERTAQVYMKLAEELPRLAHPQSSADMSISGAIKMIEGLKDPDDGPPIPKGRATIKKTDKLAEAIKSAPLAILERAWEEAADNERTIFLKKVAV
jgi:hypothetical protein